MRRTRDINKIVPEMKRNMNIETEKMFSDIILNEYPEIKNYLVKYDIDKQGVHFEGLTLDQQTRVLKIANQKQ
jgi:hypothetical protein